jgi:excisionase family DNA binding protein
METSALTIDPRVYYTLDEAASKLRISSRALLTMVRAGRVHGVRCGRAWRILGDDLMSVDRPPEHSDVAFWVTASQPALVELWDNDDDACFDSR